MDVEGPGLWRALHALGKHFSGRPNEFEEVVRAIFREMVCFVCIKDAFDYLDQHPITRDTELWVCRFHNHVNRKLGKETYRCKKSHN